MEYKLKPSPEELEALKLEFKKLKTIAEKFNFWQKRLGVSYPYYCRISQMVIRDFMIRPTKKREIKEINQMVLEDSQYRLFDRLLDKDKLINEFETGLKNAIIKKDYIDSQYKKAERDIELRMRQDVPAEERSDNKWFETGFREYRDERKKPDFSSYPYSAPTLIAYYNGFVMADYLFYLEDFIAKWEKGNKKMKLLEETSIKQQILILYYLGYAGDLFENKTRSSNLLSILLNKNAQDIKENLTHFNVKAKQNDIKTKGNLTFVLELFTRLKLNGQVEKVKKDLNELS